MLWVDTPAGPKKLSENRRTTSLSMSPTNMFICTLKSSNVFKSLKPLAKEAAMIQHIFQHKINVIVLMSAACIDLLNVTLKEKKKRVDEELFKFNQF